MMARDNEMKKIRPSIPSIALGREVSDAERFQNTTLRPILKMQNELLLSIFRNYIQKRKGVFYERKEEGRLKYIEDALRNDFKLRNLMVGVVLGQFTLAEWSDFEKETNELTRRIVSMLVERLQDQMAEL